jgi:hypothetical protein
MKHRFGMIFLTISALMCMGADCGHGGGSPCPQRAAGEGPDAGPGDPTDDDWPPDLGDDPEEGNAETNTGGSTGGGTNDCPQR